jgi:ubiquinone/menaquinone biosynthesis C-methylase UbiE
MARADPSRLHLGLDRSGPTLARAASRARAARTALWLVQADALALPARDGAFDGATGHSILYLLPDAVAALRELRRALRPGGRVAFLEPRAAGADLAEAARRSMHHAVAMTLWRGMSGLHRRYDEATLPALLAEAGFAAPRAWPVLSGYGVMATAERGG